MRQEPQAQLEQTQIAPMTTMNNGLPTILLGARAQVDHPQVGPARRQHQAGDAGRVAQMALVQLKSPAFLVRKESFNGLITNDKFCLSRARRLPLAWSRRPLRLRCQEAGTLAYPPDEHAHRGGIDETSMENSPSLETSAGWAAALGPGLPASSAMGQLAPNPMLHSDAGGVS